ncbi:GNAT family N-acetyltransferase [Intrasporangium sp.]|uniref:GNAT family N-acetyltransferase n=1 Tax=Intrasporangium sp. TaxID=1925024 RepID=UPI00293A1948|nr:GNAT family N-acetyltransferase [Intrasporangium sp.]MDV3222925.1 GNAT family N-acetyltransferase [Intrasporangium sp.]
MTRLETARLVLREFTHDDAQFVLELHQHPDLVRFIATAALQDLAGAHEVIDLFLAVEGPDRGWWCACLRDGTPVGAVLLKDIRASQGREVHDVEVGWRQHVDHCGRGYMTEAARAVVDLGFQTGLDRIVAVVDPENHPSRRICERLGMRYEGRTTDYYDDELDLYVIRRPGVA